MRNQAYIYLTIVGVSSSARGKGFGSKLMDAIKQECDNEGLNLYLVNGVLIDTGPGRLSAIIVPFLENQKIEIVLLTHCHEDHSVMPLTWPAGGFLFILILLH